MIRISMLAAAALLVGATADVQACSGKAGQSTALANVSVADVATDLSSATKSKKKKAKPKAAAGTTGAGGSSTGKPPADKPSSY